MNNIETELTKQQKIIKKLRKDINFLDIYFRFINRNNITYHVVS